MVSWWPCSTCQRRAARIDEAEEHRRHGNEHYKSGRLDEAIAAYGEALRLKPKEGTYWLNRSIAHRQKEDWVQAERDAARAVELQPSSEKAAYGRAMALQKLDRTADALVACSDFLKSDPDNKPLLQLRKTLEQTSKPLADAKLNAAEKPSPSRAKAAAKQQNVDYSKWNEFEDSDDELERKAKEKEWKGKNPTTEERLSAVDATLEYCRSLAEESSVLFPNSRVPENVKLPVDYGSPVGVLDTKQLSKFNSNHTRQLVSLYGDIFDVSNRPDQYGYGGPKAFQTGRDITWSIISGKESPENCNRFFDIFKLDDEHCARYLHIMCQKMVGFENEFGSPVGRLENFVDEQALPPAPVKEIEECSQQ